MYFEQFNFWRLKILNNSLAILFTRVDLTLSMGLYQVIRRWEII